MYIPDFAVFSIATIVYWLIYTGLLWGMIKIQKLNYNLLGLFGSSLLASLINNIPVVGTYLAPVVLVFCLWKCTRADIAPDVLFTVVIAGALMFCINLWVIAALIGELRPDLRAAARDADESSEMDEADAAGAEEDADETEATPASSKPASPAPSSKSAAAPAKTPAPAPVNASNLQIKGISSGAHPSAMISDGSKVHNVSPGDSFTATLAGGRQRLRCVQINGSTVVIKTEEGQTIQLQLK